MEDTSAETKRAEQAPKPKQFATISERKLKANRENAKKSTGPRTARGKAFSRWNSVEHGFFVNYITDFEALREDPSNFQDLLNGLRDHYQPVGRIEEVEVERIAICSWRLKRAWRYENAVNLAAKRDFLRAELDDQEPYCKKLEEEEKAILLLLQEAKKEIENSGEISPELKERIIAAVPPFESLWLAFNGIAQEQVKQPHVSRGFQKLNPKHPSWVIAMLTVTNLIHLFEQFSTRRWTNVLETAVGGYAIPNQEALNRLLRYDTTADRALNRALDRLECLQRRRRSEPVLPPVRVQITQ